jgi:8-oxo-dGTP diphosphatase/2-hydroxy-dATP diphosphatase
MKNVQVQTLLLIIKNEKILLGMKKRGFGVGRYNGFGGKLDPGEAPLQAARREMKEETGVDVRNITKCGVIKFFSGIRETIEMHVYRTDMYEGEFQESEEMRPKWFRFNRIPYSRMWPDDQHWLPLVITGKKVRAHFFFNEKDEIIKKQVMVY